MVIVGSSAAKYWWDDWREPNDIDVWTCGEAILIYNGVDAHTLPEEILKLIPTENGYATPDALYTIKLSHLGWDNPNWEKHKLDVLCMEYRGCNIIHPLFYILVDYWKKELGNKDFLSLSQSKEDFFTDNVEYKYDHDLLHELVAHPDTPVYTKVLKEGEDVLIDRDKFDKLDFCQQVRMFREEMTVIAVERWLVPSNGMISWRQAYKWAVRKTITSLTKGWATEFIVHNLKYFVKPDYSYFKNILEELDMSNKVDLTPFEKALELGLRGEYNQHSLEDLVYCMCEGEIDVQFDQSFPERNGRTWDDPEYKKEVEDYRAAYAKHKEDVLSELGGYEHLAQDGGGEGGAEDCYGVFRLGDKIYRAEYSYYSYNGHEYDYILNTLKEVQPKQKTITVYE